MVNRNSSSDELRSKSGGKQWSCSRMEVATITYNWTITNFSLRPEDCRQQLASPIFYTDDEKSDQWSLKLYPRGEIDRDSISVLLTLVAAKKPEIFVQCELSILEPNNSTKSCMQKFCHRYKLGSPFGCKKFVSRDDLLSPANNLLKDDCLTICCIINIPLNTVHTSSTHDLRLQIDNSRKRRLGDDFRMVLRENKWSDVQIIVGHRKYHAHRVILASRSAVFAKIFDKDWKEQKQSVVHINGTADEIVKGILQFIYTDTVNELEDRVVDYFAAAKKYKLAALEVKCEEIMLEMVNDQTAADYLLAAELFGATDLKEQLIQYIIKNMAGVIHSKGYKELAANYPHLVFEMLEIQTKQLQKMLRDFSK